MSPQLKTTVSGISQHCLLHLFSSLLFPCRLFSSRGLLPTRCSSLQTFFTWPYTSEDILGSGFNGFNTCDRSTTGITLAPCVRTTPLATSFWIICFLDSRGVEIIGLGLGLCLGLISNDRRMGRRLRIKSTSHSCDFHRHLINIHAFSESTLRVVILLRPLVLFSVCIFVFCSNSTNSTNRNTPNRIIAFIFSA